MRDILIENGTIINEGKSYKGFVIICGERIAAVGRGNYRDNFSGQRIDADGKLIIPGVIDDQVHFREPGLTYKADIHSESIAAVAGGVTSFMEMPNTKPATTNSGELDKKFEIGAKSSLANYSFYLGATNDNLDEIRKLDPRRICGVKLFMGSSTGNMLVDDDYSLSAIFAESPVLVASHCEDETIIRTNTEIFRNQYGNDVVPSMHPLIRSAEACYRSTAKAVELADRYGANVHVLHLSTGRELSLFDAKPLTEKKITNEICVHHLWFEEADYARLGNTIKWNPAIKTSADRDALREGITNGKCDIVATDHAPHTLEEKQRPYWECPSGGPLVQHSLTAMLEMARNGIWSREAVVEKMCHAPAIRYSVQDRGFLREGYYADIVIVDPDSDWTVNRENILYKCGWCPLDGVRFKNRVVTTIINGYPVMVDSQIDNGFRGKELVFDR